MNPNKELGLLQNWFHNEYQYKEQKYRRLIAMGKMDDDGVSPQTKLNLLYQEAENNRLRIQELERMIQL